jgi:hypothetical protein
MSVIELYVAKWQDGSWSVYGDPNVVVGTGGGGGGGGTVLNDPGPISDADTVGPLLGVALYYRDPNGGWYALPGDNANGGQLRVADLTLLSTIWDGSNDTPWDGSGTPTLSRLLQGVYSEFNRGATPDISQVPVDDTPTLINAAAPLRRSLILTNMGSDTVFIHTSNAVSSLNGYPLVLNASMTIQNQADVYGICASGQTAVVAYYADSALL